MSNFLRNKKNEISDGNRYYWKITKMLPVGVKFAHKKFELHNKLFHCCPFWKGEELNVCIILSHFSRDENCSVPFFNVRIGIVGEDLVELGALKAESPTDSVRDIFTVENLIHRSETDSPMLRLFVEIRREDDNIQLAQNKKIKAGKEKIEADYRDLLLSGKNSDVTLELKGKKYYCHRCILAARSPVFAAIMDNDMEQRGNSGDVIREDSDTNLFQKFLLFLYTGKEDCINFQNVSDLYILADKYGVEDMKSVCRNIIKENNRLGTFCMFFNLSLKHNHLQLNNVLGDVIKENIRKGNLNKLFKLSLLHNDPEITKIAVKMFLKNTKDIIGHGKWTEFLPEDLNKWLSIDNIKEIITAENFFFFFKLSLIQNDSELTETTVQFFLKHSNIIMHSENWMTLQVENPVECVILIRALAKKYQKQYRML